MGRMVGTVTRGILSPIFKQGDDIVKIVTDTVINASAAEGFEIRDRDIIAITESVIARAQGNYAQVDDIAEDVRKKFGKSTIGIIFPILSRNRFALCLKGIAKGAEKIVLMLSYPADEVGNHLIDEDQLDEKGVNPWVDVFTEKTFREYFGYNKHAFTGIDYIDYYKSIIEECGTEYEIILSNNPKTILEYTKSILVCDIHTRKRTKKILRDNGAEIVYGLDDILSLPVGESGYNEVYGLLGSNKATEDSGTQSVSYLNSRYLTSYYKIADSGIILIGMMPEKELNSAASTVIIITVIIMAAAVLIALATGYFMANSMRKTINLIVDASEQAASGDLSMSFKSERKDELGKLTNSINSMISSMRMLIEQTKNVSEKVSSSANVVSSTSGHVSSIFNEISRAIRNIWAHIMRIFRHFRDFF
jgi:HAMP domain-containing protein